MYVCRLWSLFFWAISKRKLTVAAGFSLRRPQAEACGYGQLNA